MLIFNRLILKYRICYSNLPIPNEREKERESERGRERERDVM